jgi:hypothetical protein
MGGGVRAQRAAIQAANALRERDVSDGHTHTARIADMRHPAALEGTLACSARSARSAPIARWLDGPFRPGKSAPSGKSA